MPEKRLPPPKKNLDVFLISNWAQSNTLNTDVYDNSVNLVERYFDLKQRCKINLSIKNRPRRSTERKTMIFLIFFRSLGHERTIFIYTDRYCFILFYRQTLKCLIEKAAWIVVFKFTQVKKQCQV